MSKASVDEIASFDGRIAKVVGAVATGKTEALLRRCAELLKAGTDPHDIAVCTTSGLAAQQFAERLHHLLGDELREVGEQVTVKTALEYCTDVLATDDARAFTGRNPRLLDSCEYTFFLEDLKTTGVPRRRMRKMLAKIYEKWAALEDEDVWLDPGDETTVRELMDRLLRTTGSMLPQEAPTICAGWLKSEDGKGACKAYGTVLVDDFQNLTHAEQTCMCLLARDQLIVAGNSMEAVGTLADAKGFDMFDSLRRGVTVFELQDSPAPEVIVKLTNAVAKSGNPDAPQAVSTQTGDETSGRVIKWNTPYDEMKGMAAYARYFFDKDEDLLEKTLCIIVPNKRWAHMVLKALESKGIACSLAGTLPRIGGDPRDLDHCKQLIAFLRLELLADPHDMAAWRCWCGLGNYLTNSEAWAQLLDYAEAQGLDLYDALVKTSEECKKGTEPFLRAKALAERFDEGRTFIGGNAKRVGFALARAVGMEGHLDFLDILDLMEGDETAAELCELVRSYFAHPVFSDDPHKVHVLSFEGAAGMSYGPVLALGCVDGFAPTSAAYDVIGTDDTRKVALDRQRRVFYNVLGTAHEHLIVSLFSKSPLELAERSKMRVMRVRSEEGERMALLHPSMYLEEAETSCPPTTGGQTLLAELGIG